MKNILPLLFAFAFTFSLFSQNAPVKDQYVNGFWDAHWIAHPTAPAKEYGVYHFRRTFDLPAKPETFIIHVSADNRYKLYVNGAEAVQGPARGDLEHWRFESLDIAEFLVEGKNALAAVVWNGGEYAPVAQISLQTAFILQGNGQAGAIVNTGPDWKVTQNEAYVPEMESRRALRTYLVVGPGDIVDGEKYPWGWEQIDYQDTNWLKPRILLIGQTFGRGTDGGWRLVPRRIPMMEKYPMRLAAVRRAEGVDMPPDFLSGKEALVIPADTKASVLLDQGHLTTGYPEFIISGGKGSKVKVSYSEALYMRGDNSKGNRNEIEGKEMRGYADVFLPDGGKGRSFKPLWNRTWRYMQLDIETGDEPLAINDLKAEFWGYPFEEKAAFSSDQPWLQDVWTTGWRTARLCAGETYFDCPYYEQLQYVGDTRIQALISLYVAGDDRLMRRAIDDFDQSRLWNGLTQSRYPSSKLQVIPPYSLFWIAMIYDHWMHMGDEDYVRSLLPGVQSILGWYERQINSNGLLGNMKWWHFTDWTEEWPWNEADRIGGVPPTDEEGNSSVLSVQYAYALQYAEKLHRAMGDGHTADRYARRRDEVTGAIRKWCWDEEKHLFRDLPNANIYSQHVNIIAILTDALPENEQKALMQKIMTDKSLIQATFYFRFYLFRALVKTGMADRYIDQLAPWKDMLDLGLTTFAEKPDPTRSDCHAWSASPNYDLLAIVAGIMPAEPGFKSVWIAPALGGLNKIEAKMPHPKGEIGLLLEREGEGIRGKAILPEGLSGIFHWKGREMELAPGENRILFSSNN
jgi:alpha-L-rhamnosidase